MGEKLFLIMADNRKYNDTMDFIRDENDGTAKTFETFEEAHAFSAKLSGNESLATEYGILCDNKETKWKIYSVGE